MPNPGKRRDTGCPIAFALDTFGDRWSHLVIRDLLLMGKKTYGEFIQSKESIATNILADRLKILEIDGIIVKTRDPENYRKIIYSLTEKGCDLAPLLLEMIRWSAKHDPNTRVTAKVLKRIQIDRDGFAADLRSRALAAK